MRYRVFSSIFSFCKVKGCHWKKLSFTDYTSGIRFPDCRKLAIDRKNENGVTTCWYDFIVKLFSCCFVSLVKFNYWFKFPVNIITDSWVKTIFFFKGLTENFQTQVSALIETISYDIDNFIDKTPIEEIRH